MEPLPKEVNFPSRPKYVERVQHRKVRLVSNHYRVDLNKTQPHIYQYGIKLILDSDNSEVDEQNRFLIMDILRSIRKDLESTFGKGYWPSGKMLWALKDVPKQSTFKAKVKGDAYIVMIDKKKNVSLSKEALNDSDIAAQVRQYVNVAIKTFFRNQNYKEWGRNAKFYDVTNPINLTAVNVPLEVFTGFKTSCEVYQNNTLKVLVDFSSRIVRTDSVLDYLYKYGERPSDLQHAAVEIIGRSVVAYYGNFRMWRIDDIDFSKGPNYTFTDSDGQKKSIAQYYKKKYNVQLQWPDQPLLVNKNRKTGQISLLVPELMAMTGMSDEMRQDFNLMKEVAKYTRLEPDTRMGKIDEFTRKLSNDLDTRQSMLLSMENTVEGIELSAPSLTLGKKSFTPEGNYQLRDPIAKPAFFKNWLLIHQDSKYGSNDAKTFVQTLKKCSGAFGISVNDPKVATFKSKDPKSVQQVLTNNIKEDTQIVVAILEPQTKRLYSTIKDFCSGRVGVPSQVVVNKSLQKNAMSVCSKILIQMNVKIGFEPWFTQIPEGLPKNTMVIGADVFHRFDRAMNSCIGFCASIDPLMGQFYSQIHLQKQGEEIMLNIGKLVKQAIIRFFKRSKKLPECIIFYRDGVGEGQIKTIIEKEVSSIYNTFEDFSKEFEVPFNPKFAEIVVTKKINDRFFKQASSQGGGGGRGGSRGGRGRGGGHTAGGQKTLSNPSAGTVVYQDCVSDSNGYDFFLISQNVTQGTCTPTHYQVIYDDTGLSQDVIWQLTYNQCYNYYNWGGGVKVPAPIQYADKLAYQVGHYMKEAPHEELLERLHYL